MNTECPIDMSVASSKPRSPPPPYREPLPGSTFASTLAARPSVITQAPKREPISNQENDKDTTACGKNFYFSVSIHIYTLKLIKLCLRIESISMIDPVIDEHFRRSLGADYINIFGNNKKSPNHIAKTIPKKLPTISSTTPPPKSPPIAVAQPQQTTSAVTRTITTVTVQSSVVNDSVGMSVDDHFAKALGCDTWQQLKAADSCRNESNRNSPSLAAASGVDLSSSVKN